MAKLKTIFQEQDGLYSLRRITAFLCFIVAFGLAIFALIKIPVKDITWANSVIFIMPAFFGLIGLLLCVCTTVCDLKTVVDTTVSAIKK